MHRLSWSALALWLGCSISFSGCKVLDTMGPDPTPTPAPTGYPVSTYVAALRAASVKLRGRLPSVGEITAVQQGGASAYEAAVDQWLDPSANPDLVPQVKVFYRSLFRMGGVIADEGTADPDPYAATNTNYDLPADLAAYLFVNDRPVTELVTSDLCVGDDLEILDDAVASVACEGAPKNGPGGNHRAGVIGLRPFLRKYGQPNTLNLRRTSLVHQIFACEIYPDSQDPLGLIRTNSAESTWPINDNLTPADTSDDFPDPQLGSAASDPSIPDRLSKKYQTAKGGITCHSCHSRLNLRRPIFTPYTPEGIFDPLRSMANTRDPDTGSVENNVESPAENNGKDYCGVLGDTEADPDTGEFGVGDGSALNDDVDGGAFECAENGRGPAWYHGQEARTLREYGFALVNEAATGSRFQACMTRRHVNFVLGRSQGDLGMGAAGGTAPTPLSIAAQTKFQTLYEAGGWSTRELVRRTLKSNEFLESQQ